MLKPGLLASAVAVIATIAAAGQDISIQLVDGDFRVTGWKAAVFDPANVFAVYIGTGNIPPLLGSYSAGKGVLLFHPRFPLAAGVHYRAVFQLPGTDKVEAFFDGPPADTVPSTRIEHIYPSAGILPVNQLKLYLYFSAAMSSGEAWQHIHLLDDAGREVPLAFLEQELWDPENRRLTVLFDPGRIKRGLVPNNEIGPPLLEGKQYMLVIDADWKDARGVQLVEGFRKAFRAGPADRISPDTAQWHIQTPKAGTRDALLVDFPEPLDYALLQRLLDVSGVRGAITVERNETQWRFTPDEPWRAGAYKLIADTRLEDLAGNHLDRLFDVDTLEENPERVAEKTVTLPFSVE